MMQLIRTWALVLVGMALAVLTVWGIAAILSVVIGQDVGFLWKPVAFVLGVSGIVALMVHDAQNKWPFG